MLPETGRLILAAVTSALLAAACAAVTPSGTETSGVVVFHDLEGGFYAIRGDDGVTYDPLNLPAEFRCNGLRVVATLRAVPGAVSIRQVGPIVEVIAIRAR